MRFYPLLHRWANRLRVQRQRVLQGTRLQKFAGPGAIPHKCCRHGPNRGNPRRLVLANGSELVTTQCSVCDRRHYEMTADTGQLGVRQA